MTLGIFSPNFYQISTCQCSLFVLNVRNMQAIQKMFRKLLIFDKRNIIKIRYSWENFQNKYFFLMISEIENVLRININNE